MNLSVDTVVLCEVAVAVDVPEGVELEEPVNAVEAVLPGGGPASTGWLASTGTRHKLTITRIEKILTMAAVRWILFVAFIFLSSLGIDVQKKPASNTIKVGFTTGSLSAK